MLICHFFRVKKSELNFFHAKKVFLSAIFNGKKVGQTKKILFYASCFLNVCRPKSWTDVIFSDSSCQSNIVQAIISSGSPVMLSKKKRLPVFPSHILSTFKLLWRKHGTDKTWYYTIFYSVTYFTPFQSSFKVTGWHHFSLLKWTFIQFVIQARNIFFLAGLRSLTGIASEQYDCWLPGRDEKRAKSNRARKKRKKEKKEERKERETRCQQELREREGENKRRIRSRGKEEEEVS